MCWWAVFLGRRFQSCRALRWMSRRLTHRRRIQFWERVSNSPRHETKLWHIVLWKHLLNFLKMFGMSSFHRIACAWKAAQSDSETLTDVLWLALNVDFQKHCTDQIISFVLNSLHWPGGMAKVTCKACIFVSCRLLPQFPFSLNTEGQHFGKPKV